MLKKALKKLSRATTPKREKSEKPVPSKEAPSVRLLTAEGWKRLMMKKHRN